MLVVYVLTSPLCLHREGIYPATTWDTNFVDSPNPAFISALKCPASGALITWSLSWDIGCPIVWPFPLCCCALPAEDRAAPWTHTALRSPCCAGNTTSLWVLPLCSPYWVFAHSGLLQAFKLRASWFFVMVREFLFHTNSYRLSVKWHISL